MLSEKSVTCYESFSNLSSDGLSMHRQYALINQSTDKFDMIQWLYTVL